MTSLTPHIVLEIMLLQQANSIIRMARLHSAKRSDLALALANMETVLLHWIAVLKDKPHPPVHQVQRHD